MLGWLAMLLFAALAVVFGFGDLDSFVGLGCWFGFLCIVVLLIGL